MHICMQEGIDCTSTPALLLLQLQYLSIRYMVGQQVAAIGFSLLAALVPAWERQVMALVEVRGLWRSGCASCKLQDPPWFSRGLLDNLKPVSHSGTSAVIAP